MSVMESLVGEKLATPVEFIRLGELAFYSDTRVDSDVLNEENFVGVDNLLQNAAGKENASFSANTSRLTGYVAGDILLGNIRPYLKKIWLADRNGGCSGDVLAIRIKTEFADRIQPDFLFTVLSSDRFFDYNMRHAKGAKMPRGNKHAILDYKIPLPALEAQAQITQAIRDFSNLEQELVEKLLAEKCARKSQYGFYREALLRPNNLDERIALGQIGEFTRGRRFTKDDYDPEGISCIHYGDIYTSYGTSAEKTISHVRQGLAGTLRFAKTSDVIIAAVGETVEDVGKAVAWLGQEDVAVHDDCFIFSHNQNAKYISYCLQSEIFSAEKNRFVTRAKVKRLSGGSLAKLRIPVPPINEQDRIVGILDEFEAQINHLTAQIESELEMRRQQFAHYRDDLLTFKEAA